MLHSETKAIPKITITTRPKYLASLLEVDTETDLFTRSNHAIGRSCAKSPLNHRERSDDFKNSTLSTVRTICKLPRLNLSSEEELFEAVVEWTDSQPGSKVSKRDVLLPLLRNIRFLGIPAMKFTQIVKKCPNYKK
ncbi:hypothetical protein AVEN_84706-1, partial [Araneus ventricosus]